jgi:hypothetical protein
MGWPEDVIGTKLGSIPKAAMNAALNRELVAPGYGDLLTLGHEKPART